MHLDLIIKLDSLVKIYFPKVSVHLKKRNRLLDIMVHSLFLVPPIEKKFLLSGDSIFRFLSISRSVSFIELLELIINAFLS